MPLKHKEAFVAAFASIPQRVLWKFEEPIENLASNIMLSNWLPQRDILGTSNFFIYTHTSKERFRESVFVNETKLH